MQFTDVVELLNEGSKIVDVSIIKNNKEIEKKKVTLTTRLFANPLRTGERWVLVPNLDSEATVK